MLSEAFWTLNIVSLQFDEYSQLGSWRKVCPIKNQLGSPNTSKQVHEQTFVQLRTGFRQQTSWLLTVTTTYSDCKASRVYREEAMYKSLLPMSTTTCLLTDRITKRREITYRSPVSPTALHQQGEGFKNNNNQKHLKNARRGEGREGGLWCKMDKAWTVNTVVDWQNSDSQHSGWLTELWQTTLWLTDWTLTVNTVVDWPSSNSQHCVWKATEDASDLYVPTACHLVWRQFNIHSRLSSKWLQNT